MLDEQAENGANGVVRERAKALSDIITPVLVWLRDHKGVSLNSEMIRLAINSHWIWKLATEKIALLPERNPETGALTELRLSGEFPEELALPMREYLFGEPRSVRSAAAYRSPSSLGEQS